MAADPEILPWEKVIARLLDVIGEKTPTASVEFGWDEDDPRKAWAKAHLRSGRVRMAEAQNDDVRLAAIDAVAELGRELGLSIRIRDPLLLPPDDPIFGDDGSPRTPG